MIHQRENSAVVGVPIFPVKIHNRGYGASETLLCLLIPNLICNVNLSNKYYTGKQFGDIEEELTIKKMHIYATAHIGIVIRP